MALELTYIRKKFFEAGYYAMYLYLVGVPGVSRTTNLSPSHQDTLNIVLLSIKPSICDTCEEESTKMVRCNCCKNAWYCSKECQKKAWKTHKKNCVSYDDIVRLFMTLSS